MELIKIFDIEELAQEFVQAPQVDEIGKNKVLLFDYEKETGEYALTGITFLNVINFKHTKEDKISEYMLKAYNAVVEIKNSKWLETYNVTVNDTYKHYMVYFDGFGAYEFICTDVIRGIK